MNVGESRYELIELIGSGGMAEVYRARMVGAVGFEKLVAIKRLLPHVTSDQEFVQRFIDEARLTARLVHPNICQILDFGVMDDCYFIAMEYVDGLDLAGVLKGEDREGERVPVDVALYVICGVLRGLKAAHEATDDTGRPLGIVHRDVSPHNVLLSVNGDVKLSDLGAATANEAFRSTRTQKHYRLGKVLYMAPEQRRRKSVDARADLYSAGILLAEMLLGMSDFHQEANMFLAGMCSLWDKISDRLASPLGQALAQVVRHALAEDPARRYQNADGMLSELEGLLVEYAPGTSVDRVARMVQRLKRRRLEKGGSIDVQAPEAEAMSLHTEDLDVMSVDSSTRSDPTEGDLPNLFPDDAPAMMEDPGELDDVMTIARPDVALPHKPTGGQAQPALVDDAEESQLKTTVLRKKRPNVGGRDERSIPGQLPVGPPGPNAAHGAAQPSPPYLELVVEDLERPPARVDAGSTPYAGAQPSYDGAAEPYGSEPSSYEYAPAGLEAVPTQRDAPLVESFAPTSQTTVEGSGGRRRTMVFVAFAVPIVLFLGVLFGGLIALRLFPDEPYTEAEASPGASAPAPTPATRPDSATPAPAKAVDAQPQAKTAPAPTPSPAPTPAPQAPSKAAPAKTTPRPEPPREQSPSHAEATSPPQQRHQRSEGYGYLNINSRPYGIPYVDGRQISAETPVARHRVSAGRHVVSIRFPQTNQRQQRVVVVQPGETSGITFTMP